MRGGLPLMRQGCSFEAARFVDCSRTVVIIKEPEAAALYTLHALDFTLNVGDAFVLCDAGGGTVDLISYEVEDVSPRLLLKELVPGTGESSVLPPSVLPVNE